MMHLVPFAARQAACSRRILLLSLLACLAFPSLGFAQAQFFTGHSDNQRTGANTNETLLTPANVNKNNFGRLFNYSLDYQALAQPLYVPNVPIPGQGTHNVVYVATMADSVYAFDADSNQGPNAAPLWHVNFTDPANGITTASVATNTLPCATTETKGPGITQEGIVSTPAIDIGSGTIYVVAKTLENGTVRHRLHALDITSGQEKFGGPALITATSVSNAGHKMVFNNLHQKNRPGLLLLNGVIYMAFGSNYCNDSNTGWVLAYDAASLQQVGAFNTSPDTGHTSIWQSGHGLAADPAGNVYAETAEGKFDVPTGGQSYANSVLKLSATPLVLTDYFTPWNIGYLNTHDLDMSSSGPVILPDQPGPYPHVLVAAGKEGTVYILNRDNLGQYNPAGDSQIVQELPLAVGPMFDSPDYWNGMVYFAGNADYLKGYSLNSGQLSPLPIVTSTQKYVGSHSPSISANGNTNGLLWLINGGQLNAFDASSLVPLYNTKQNAPRDQLPAISHFITQTVVNGKVYVATRTTLEVYGLYPFLSTVSGASQSATVFTTLPVPIQLQAIDPYGAVGLPGVTVTFSDGGKGGTFNPSTAISDNSGYVSTSYTLPKISGTYTLTVSASGLSGVSFSETALPGPAVKLSAHAGNKQTGNAGTVLPLALSAKVQDAYGNGVPGITVAFDDQNKGGAFNPTSQVSDKNGFAPVMYQLPNKPGKYTPRASAAGLKALLFTEYAVVGPPAALTVVAGNNQSASVNTPLPQPLVVQLTDRVGNAIVGATVSFSAPAGSFTGNPATTDANGNASVTYTTGTVTGTFTITATAGTLSAQFTVTVSPGAAASVSITSGNNQAAPAGTQLPGVLSVRVADQYNNPVPGVAVNFSDGNAGGSFSNINPVMTDNTGTAVQIYTLPHVPGVVNVSATAGGVGVPAVFTETAQ